jgi:hypothetical protein
MEVFKVDDKRVTYYKLRRNAVAIVSDEHFKISGLDEWWCTELGAAIKDNLFDSNAHALGIYISDGDNFNDISKIKNILILLERRYVNCNDGVMAMTNCFQCSDIIKIGEPMECLKFSVGNAHMCNKCLYK